MFGNSAGTDTSAAANPAGPPAPQVSDDEFAAFMQRAKRLVADDDKAAEQRDYEALALSMARPPLEELLAFEIRELGDKKPATQIAYTADLKNFAGYCRSIKMPTRPAAPEIVAHFLLKQFEDGGSLSAVRRAAAAIGWAHQSFGNADPTEDIIVRAAVRYVANNSEPQGTA